METVLINEKISAGDFIFKYTLRDFLLGILRMIPSSIGVALRLIILPPFFKSCGKGFLVKEGVIFKFPENIKIGNHVGISEYTLIDGDGGISIGNFVRIASHVSVISFEHNYQRTNAPIKFQGKTKKKVIIEDDVWIGSGVRVLAGVKIGKGSIIGANSVVTKTIPPLSIAIGLPARVIKRRHSPK